ncbi:MAG: T9SS type A sorting domain-containing protein [Bacteroidetes bacterium]|nr:T9SS type A sorting domain-containing protein [Bacteroidota bacterium]
MNKIYTKLMTLVLALFLTSQAKAQVTIFSEDWTSNTFTANNWTFPLGQGNWTIGAAYTPIGGTAPNAFFSYNPTLTNYSISLLSNTISATTYTAGPILLDYVLQLNNFSTSTLEQFKVEYKTVAGTTWSTVALYTNTLSGTMNWTVANYTLTGMQGQIFQLRFTAFGANSFNINGWGLDNINVKTPCIPSLAASLTPSTLCAPGPKTITASGSSNYTWTPGGSTSTSIVVSPTVSTTYTLASTNTVIGCVETRTIVVGVTPTVTITGPSTVCVPSSATLTANGAVTYTWSTGSTSSVIVTAPASTTVYSVTGNSSGCTSTAQYTLYTAAAPVIAVTPSAPCSPGSKTLTASGSNTYTWSPGGFTTSSIVVTPTVSTTYTLVATNTVVGCNQTVTKLVSVTPTVNITGPATVCATNPATLTASGASTYTWSTGSTSGTIVPSPTATTVYSVTGNSGGCTGTAQFTVNTVGAPVIAVTPSAPCVPGSKTLTASGSNSYTWSPGGFTTASIVVSPTISTTYTVIATNTVAGCTQTVTQLISISPTVNITGPSTVCVSSPATLMANGASSYTWSTGSTAVSIATSPSATTVYSVTGNSGGCTASSQFTLTTVAGPSITISGSQIICSPAANTFTASGASNYTWSPSVNLTTTSGPVVTTTNVTGPITVFVTGQNSTGCSATLTLALSYNPAVSITSLTSSSYSLCSGSSATMAVTAANASVAPFCQPVYSSGTGFGDYIGGVTLGNITNTTTGLAAPYYTMYPSSITTTLTAGTAYTLTLQPGTYSSSNGLASWIDYNQNGNLYDANEKIAQMTINAAFPVSGIATFTVPLTATNGTTTLRVREVYASSNIDPCASATYGETEDYVVTISGGVTPATTYSWAPSVFLSSTGTASTVANSVTATTMYTVGVTNSFGCSTQGTINLNVNPSPTVTAASSSSSFICVGQSATLTASGASSYVWNTTATTAVIAVSPTTTTSYTVTGTNSGGCTASTVISQSVSACTGIASHASAISMNVYPNPGTGVYTIEVENMTKIEVCDLFGKIILSATVDAGKFNLNISEQAKGLYILKATSNGRTESIRLVKE